MARTQRSKTTKARGNNTRYAASSQKHHTNQRQIAEIDVIARKFLIFLIIFSTLAVAIVVASSFFLRPEAQVKSRVERVANEYYEKRLIAEIVNSPKFSGDLEETLKHYEYTGFTQVTLRQIMYSSSEFSKDLQYLRQYCDLEKTRIKYYPVAPFNERSHSTEYYYSCKY